MWAQQASTTLVLATAAACLLLVARRKKVLWFAQRRRIAYLNTEDAAKWTDQLQVFATALDIPARCFVKFDCFRNEFPSVAALQRGDFSGVLITGSHFSAKDPSLTWLPSLFECIRTAAKIPHVHVLGCCFGCQACAVALGGDVGKNPDGTFVFGAESISLRAPQTLQRTLDNDRCSRSKHGSDASPLPASLRLLEAHGEQVLTLPRGAECVASSASCSNEIFVAGEYSNVLAVQAHAEFDVPLMRSRIEPALLAKGRLSSTQLETLCASGIADCTEHSKLTCGWYRRFLLGESGESSW